MSDKLPAFEIGYIRKVRENGDPFEVAVGFIAEYLKNDGREPPPGWEWYEPPEELRGRVVAFLEDKDCCCGVCPLPDDCDELNRCVAQRLLEAFDTNHDMLVGFRLGWGAAGRAVSEMAVGARRSGEDAKADQLQATAAILERLK